MTIKLNKEAYEQAEKLVRAGKVVRDERDDWSEHAVNSDKENAWLDEHGWKNYALWHLGEDKQKSERTKGRFAFPYGDYDRVHRCAVISMESRAAQYDHDDIAKASKKLLELIDSTQ